MRPDEGGAHAFARSAPCKALFSAARQNGTSLTIVVPPPERGCGRGAGAAVYAGCEAAVWTGFGFGASAVGGATGNAVTGTAVAGGVVTAVAVA